MEKQIQQRETQWYRGKVSLLGCMVHSDVETGAVVMGDVVVISYKCRVCGKATTVEHVL